MILINHQPYRGRFHEKAVELVKSGVRVGFMWVSGEKIVHCHICNKDFTPPEIDKIHKDAFGECSNCKAPFIFAQP